MIKAVLLDYRGKDPLRVFTVGYSFPILTIYQKGDNTFRLNAKQLKKTSA